MSNANFTKALHPKQTISTSDDIFSKAYAAGFITRYGDATIYGTGAERGTYNQFAVITINNITHSDARENSTWFTNIYSKALRNQGKTHKKKKFYLSQQQEILPVLEFFGLKDEYHQLWSEIYQYDRINDLPYEWETKKVIHHWETRTKQETISFIDKEVEIMESVTNNLLTPTNICLLNDMGLEANLHESAIQEAFIEGLRGLSLTATDLSMLKQSKSIMAQYQEPVQYMEYEKVCA